MPIELTPPYQDLTFMTPLSEGHADRLVAFASRDTNSVVDVGCGWAELLLRVVAGAPGARGVGIDLDQTAIEHGRSTAALRHLDSRVDLRVGDAAETPGDRVDAAICIGASQIWGPPVEQAQPLDYRAALHALRSLLTRGGRLVYGEGVWSREPTPAATAALSGRADEFIALPDVLDIAVSEGFRPVHVFEASQDEWDEFESGYSACYATWLSRHPCDHPDADAVRQRADRQRQAYFRGYRGVLGMAYFGLIAV
ncbi:class I SAM-dependent methyltransferase [Nakamurella sp. A5-74]|uniref:Class I SAM-dependent methyltransferase n=1 Tax=Nakamurella sp. A5-74 TaxID=3158264 RepID=A0AAU8DPL8_9ACTN